MSHHDLPAIAALHVHQTSVVSKDIDGCTKPVSRWAGIRASWPHCRKAAFQWHHDIEAVAEHCAVLVDWLRMRLNACEGEGRVQGLRSQADLPLKFGGTPKAHSCSCGEACLGQWHLTALSSHSTTSSAEHSFRSALPAPGVPLLQRFLCRRHARESVSLRDPIRLGLQYQDGMHRRAGRPVQGLSACRKLQELPSGFSSTAGVKCSKRVSVDNFAARQCGGLCQ